VKLTRSESHQHLFPLLSKNRLFRLQEHACPDPRETEENFVLGIPDVFMGIGAGVDVISVHVSTQSL